MQLPFLCKKSRAIALVLPGLSAGRLEDEIALNLEIPYQMIYSTFR